MAIVDDVQARLDSYKTNKQRRRRFNELRQLMDENDGYGTVGISLEAMALKSRLDRRIILTAKELSDKLRVLAASGKVPMTINYDGERLTIPPEKFKQPH